MIAIHNRPGSFSDKWIEYCNRYGLNYKLVDCYASDIVDQLGDCKALMWHWAHHDHKASLMARQLTYSLEAAGKFVFPNMATVWHFDDKVGQKYLLEAIAAPLVPTYVFFDKEEALEWAEHTTYPKVFKLRGGAGAENVKLLISRHTAQRYIRQAFGRGFKVKNRAHFLQERLWHFKRDRSLKSFVNIGKGIARLFVPKDAERKFPSQRNYAYFQDFVPNNDFDIRIITIGKRAFAIKRLTRKGDFRASGSGRIVYDPGEIPLECVEAAFNVSQRLGAQCLAYDFVYLDDEPLIVEVSYAFSREGYLACPGYWNEELDWVPGNFFPEFFMIEDFIRACDGV